MPLPSSKCDLDQNSYMESLKTNGYIDYKKPLLWPCCAPLRFKAGTDFFKAFHLESVKNCQESREDHKSHVLP